MFTLIQIKYACEFGITTSGEDQAASDLSLKENWSEAVEPGRREKSGSVELGCRVK